MSIDERIEALTISLEIAARDIEGLRAIAAKDGENIRALARIAEIHERRLTDLEGGHAG
jgi:hypothetical protein